MSQARVYTSRFAARKGATLTCGSCRKAIEKGEAYYWFKVGFRSNHKNIRCMKVTCYPSMSERESSKMAGVYAVTESAQDNIDTYQPDPSLDGYQGVESDLQQILSDAADGWDEVADEYEEAADAMGGAGENMQETADSIRQAADDLRSWSASGATEPEPCEDHSEAGWSDDCSWCSENATNMLQDLVTEAGEALDSAQNDIEVLY